MKNHSHPVFFVWETIKTSSDEALEAFICANRAKANISDTEIEIDLEVMEELYNRQCSRGESININAAWQELTHGQGLSYFLDKQA